MTLFSKVALPMSLTELDPLLSKEATTLFKCLLMYSGERPNPYPPAMALQVLQAGVAQPELRPEIYFQLMKQLRSNPSADSQRRYWELMALALMSFAPGAGCDDYVHVFLKAHADGAQRFLPPAPNLNPDPHPNPHPHTNPHSNPNPHPHPHHSTLTLTLSRRTELPLAAAQGAVRGRPAAARRRRAADATHRLLRPPGALALLDGRLRREGTRSGMRSGTRWPRLGVRTSRILPNASWAS